MKEPVMHYLPQIDTAIITSLLTKWRAAHPGSGILALLPEAEAAAVGTVQQVCRDIDVPLVGAIFPAIIEQSEFRSHGIWLLRFEQMPYISLHADLPIASDRLPEAIDEIADEVKQHLEGDHDITLCLLFDAMVPNIATILDELYLRLANRVHYMGANAGSETFQPMPCLFDSDRLIQNGVAVIVLRHHRGAILDHGYAVPPQMLTATSTEGNRIIQIDWRPAFEVYQEIARVQYGVEINRDNFYQYGVHIPFGIVRANGIILVRIPVALNDDGSLFCVGEVPPNSVLTLLEAPAVDSSHTLATLIDGLTTLNGPLNGRQMLLFYCAGRRLHLGIGAATREIHDLAERGKLMQLAGALSLGEIGSTSQWGYPLFHNATLVGSLWEEE